MNRRTLQLLFTAILATTCGQNHGVSSAPLEQLLATPGLGLGVRQGQPSSLHLDAAAGQYVFGQPAEPLAAAAGKRVRIGGGTEVRLSSTRSAVELLGGDSSAGVKLRPLDGPGGFASWGPGLATGASVIYASPDGQSAVVERASVTGLKEDIVLGRSLGDSLRFAWELQLGDGLEARLDADGSVGIYGVASVLGGDIQASDEKSRVLLEKARARAAKTELRFHLPAPVVRLGSGETVPGAAHFVLSEGRLELVATGLDSLAYPLSLDPTVTVTSAADLGLGNFSNLDLDATGLVKRSKTQGGVGAWSARTALPSSRHHHSSVAANGFLYLLGGQGAALLNDVLYAPLLADGSLGAWSTTTSFTTPRQNHSSVVWNGYLYVIGGSGAGLLNDVQVARLNANGTLGAFSATTSFAGAREGHTSVAWNGSLYVLGGLDGSWLSDVQFAPIKADGTLGAFTTSAVSIPGARANHASVASSGFLYVVGGSNGSTYYTDVQVAPLNADGTLGAFSASSTFTTGREGHTTVIANGYLYVLGGYNPFFAYFGDVQRAPLLPNGRLGAFATTAGFAARAFHSSVTWNGHLYVLGGRNGGGGMTLATEAAIVGNGALEPFALTTPLPTARNRLAAVAYNGFVYAIGGADAAALTEVRMAPLNANGTLGAFTLTTALPSARTLHSSVAWNGYLYVIGGFGTGYLAEVLKATINPVTGTLGAFTATTPLPSARSNHASVVYNGYLYVLGGYTGAYLSDVLVAPLNPADGTVGAFAATTALPTTRWGLAALAYNGYLYVIGGANNLGSFNDVYKATLNANGTLGPFSATTSFSGVRYRHGAVAHHGRLYVMGGSAGGSRLADVQVANFNLDGTVGAFTNVASLSSGRDEFGAVTANGWLYLLGGYTGTAVLDEVQVSAIFSSGQLGAFQATSSFTGARNGHTSVAWNGYLYVVGGLLTGNVLANDVQVAAINPDGSLGAFSVAGTFPTPRWGHATTVWNGSLYVLGGRDGTLPTPLLLNDVQVAAINPNGTLGPFAATTTFPTGRFGLATVASNGFLYVTGGQNSTPALLNDVQVAAINPNGTLGAFAATSSFTNGRASHAALAYGGFLYVIGGGGLTNSFNDVQVAAINPVNGTLGAFAPTTSFPGRARFGFASAAANGYLYVLGGTSGSDQGDVLLAPINSNGTLGAFTTTTPLLDPRRNLAAASWNGFLYVSGGNDNTLYNDVAFAPLRAPAARAQYSKLVDLGAQSTATSITVNGAATAGQLRLDYRTAPATGVFGPNLSRGVVPLGTPVLLGGNGIRYLEVRLELDDTLAAAINPDAVNERDVTDFSVLYTPDPALSPTTASVAPRGSQTFSCAGGAGALTFALNPNNSGGSINAAGVYTAGAVGSVTDTVTCTDPTSAVGTAVVTVTAGVGISPAAPSLPPRGSQTFTASGGSNAGYVWSFVTNNSGGSLSPAGAYVAGNTGGVVDTLRVTDSLLNTATTTVTVTAGLAITPASLSLAPRASNTFGTTGGSGTGMSWTSVTNNSGFTLVAGTGQYTAGSVGGVVDTIRVTDSLGNTATRSITVTAGVSLSPLSATVPPRGSQTFVPSGGSGAGFSWSFASNPSGGSLTGGAYTAGNTGSVTDVVQVTDSLGNVATANVTVTAGVSASPASASVTPRGARSFTASGGSGAGFTWTFQTNASGGNLTAGGAYTAGATGSVTDVLQVTDSLGNLALVNVTVTAGVTINPASPSIAPSGTITFTASNGSGAGYVWALVSAGSGSPTLDTGTGVYRAGTLQGTDVVRATDSLGNTTTVNVTVTNALSISPGVLSLAPRAQQTFSGSGGSGTGFVWTLLTNNSGATFTAATAAYQAGPTGGVVDTVRLTDSLGNTATVNITVTAGVTATATLPMVAPKGTTTFTAVGGSGAPFTWSFQTNASGGTIDPSSGVYVAGAVGSVTDVLRATDSLGNSGTASIGVTAGISIAAVTVAPRATQQLVATGGSGTGFAWSFVTNASMGTLSGTGNYTAGRTGPVTDVVRVVDSLGNTAQLDITVTDMVSITPSAPSVPPRGTILLMATGGSGSGYSWFFTTNRSGANLSPTNGLYQAGTVAGVVDELQVVDSLGNTATSVVNVSEQIGITPQLPTVAPRGTITFMAINGAGTITWRLTAFPSGGSIDATTGVYVAGPVGTTTDTVQATDSNGNQVSTQISVSASLALSPGALTIAPLGTQTFTATGGLADGGYTFSVTGGSGASIDPVSGLYRAGPTGRTTDVVEVRDALGSVSQPATITVTEGVSVTPGTAALKTGERQTFTARGGTGTGYVWSLASNASGGSIDPATGDYLAGETGNVTDDVLVTDSNGNTAGATVDVAPRDPGQSTVPPAERLPANGWSCGCSSSSSSGSSGLLLLAIGALLLRKRGRLSVGAAVACALALAPLEASAAAKKKKKTPPAEVTAPAPVVTPAPEPVLAAPKEVTPPPPPAPKGKPSVAVLDVEVTVPGEKLDGAAFSDMVLTAVDSAKTFKVISAKEIATMLGIERQKQLLGCSDDSASCMSEIANALGSDYLLVASVGRVGENYLVSTRLISGANNKVTARASVQAKSANSLLEAVWRATQQTLDGYGASLPPAEAQAWSARPKPTPPATLIAVDETPSRFGISAAAAFGYQPLSTPGNRGSIGAQVDLTFRRGRLDLAAGVVIARSPGARITATWALTDTRARVDVGLRGTLFPGLGYYGGGITSGFEYGLHDNFALNARVAAEAYPVAGTVVVALLGAAGVSARF